MVNLSCWIDKRERDEIVKLLDSVLAKYSIKSKYERYVVLELLSDYLYIASEREEDAAVRGAINYILLLSTSCTRLI